MSQLVRHVLAGSDDVRRQTLATQAALLRQRLDGDVWPGATLGAISTMAFDTAAIRAALDPNDPVILDDLECCGCAAAAAFLAATAPGHGPIEAPGPGLRRVQVDRDRFDRGKLRGQLHWRTGMLAAAAARHHEAIAVLASIQPHDLRDLSPAAPSWFASEAAALTATFRRDADASDWLVAAMRAADPDRVDPVSRDYVRLLVGAELELGLRVVERDGAGFGIALAQALGGHHHYYGQGDAKGGVHGQLALAPLAMACLARDLGVGLSIAITTDYVPAWIIDNTGALHG
ncbi:MAG: immunity 49 family protein [Sandaracinaceae bacterium]|jgi:hypothetical protein|nr:immunity 49 family protein [Sandaracinaceae bacterium]MBP7682417.1 immunity 49 family protein [Deltaproteobacteria bacterium]MBK6808859.1 immunity 49 family protein [Sandaracinaceae bacterium]MBK7153283.1 immunity 49 family protein [Sandaracinaceae bacterium]MBK7772809.1 immunity 49 family protein [Sandaracinaceae bacterium]